MSTSVGSAIGVPGIESTTVDARESSLCKDGRGVGAFGANDNVVCLAAFLVLSLVPFAFAVERKFQLEMLKIHSIT